jgi:hypothetical protein
MGQATPAALTREPWSFGGLDAPLMMMTMSVMEFHANHTKLKDMCQDATCIRLRVTTNPVMIAG